MFQEIVAQKHQNQIELDSCALLIRYVLQSKLVMHLDSNQRFNEIIIHSLRLTGDEKSNKY